MKKVAFFLENKDITSVNCEDILAANPGIGGTQHLIMVVSYLLMIRKNNIDVKVFTESVGRFPSEYINEPVSDFISAVKCAEEQGFEYFVFRHDARLIKDNILDKITTKMKLIVWDHVFVCFWELDYYERNNSIYKVVNVSREMNDLYLDHKVSKKSIYIYNCVNTDGVKEKVEQYPFEKRGPIVTYIGSIVPYKGLHLLAEAWPNVLKAVPNAELYVIGTGNLYNRDSKLGQFGIAEKTYEDLLMSYLSENGKIIPSVHFMGLLGKEKEEILLKTKVGVPNPSGITETFCLSAVEMQMYGARVTAIKSPGYMDTIINGELCGKKEELSSSIISLLNSNETEYGKAMSFFKDNFSYEKVLNKWETLFYYGNIESNHIINWGYRYKWLKVVLRYVKNIMPSFIVKRLPPLERIILCIERLVKGRVTYMDS